jgi:hemerythrin-like domain-containing protein
MSTTSERVSRRRVLGGALAAAVSVPLGASRSSEAAKPKAPPDAEEVSATEDLMREHGILRRLLLVYGEGIRRLEARQPLEPETLTHAAEIIRAFIENYHERDEEEFIFPRFRRAGMTAMVGLVDTLLAQHQAGRKLTLDVLRLSSSSKRSNPSDGPKLAEAMRAFIRMYEPHAAREDTVLFPAFRTLVSGKELDALQEIFEDKERALPGGGFEKVVLEVEQLERSFGIYDLALFTPRFA